MANLAFYLPFFCQLGSWGMYTGNYTTEDELRFVKRCGLLLNLDDISMLPTVKKIGMPKFLSFRINPGITKGGMKSLLFAGKDAKYGVDLTDFYINSITPPDEVQEKMDERAAMGAVGDMNTYMQFKAAQAMQDAAQGGGAGGEGGAASAGMGLGLGAGFGAMMPGMIAGAMQQAQQGGGAVGYQPHHVQQGHVAVVVKFQRHRQQRFQPYPAEGGLGEG